MPDEIARYKHEWLVAKKTAPEVETEAVQCKG